MRQRSLAAACLSKADFADSADPISGRRPLMSECLRGLPTPRVVLSVAGKWCKINTNDRSVFLSVVHASDENK